MEPKSDVQSAVLTLAENLQAHFCTMTCRKRIDGKMRITGPESYEAHKEKENVKIANKHDDEE